MRLRNRSFVGHNIKNPDFSGAKRKILYTSPNKRWTPLATLALYSEYYSTKTVLCCNREKQKGLVWGYWAFWILEYALNFPSKFVTCVARTYGQKPKVFLFENKVTLFFILTSYMYSIMYYFNVKLPNIIFYPGTWQQPTFVLFLCLVCTQTQFTWKSLNIES